MQKYTSTFHPLAEKEYLESVEWYENELIGLGEDFVKEIESIINLIESRPEIFPVKKRKMREAVVNRFPYLIIYQVLKKKQQIFVLSLFNTSRSPKSKNR